MLNTPYVKKIRWDPDNFYTHYLEFSDGKEVWTKNLAELTSYIGACKNKDEYKTSYCEYISELIGMTFTKEHLDKIISPKDYRSGISALQEFEYIVESNAEAVKQGKEPIYGATSISGSIILRELLKKEN